MIHLEKVDAKNIWKIVKLSVKDEQKAFVAENTESILEAYTTITAGNVALPFGIYDDEKEPKIAAGNYSIWRFMIDRNRQGHGLGRKALLAALEYVKSQPCGKAEYCWLSYEPENTVAKTLYASVGFRENGETDGEEVAAVLKL